MHPVCLFQSSARLLLRHWPAPCPSCYNMPRSFLVKSKRTGSYTPRPSRGEIFSGPTLLHTSPQDVMQTAWTGQSPSPVNNGVKETRSLETPIPGTGDMSPALSPAWGPTPRMGLHVDITVPDRNWSAGMRTWSWLILRQYWSSAVLCLNECISTPIKQTRLQNRLSYTSVALVTPVPPRSWERASAG